MLKIGIKSGRILELLINKYHSKLLIANSRQLTLTNKKNTIKFIAIHEKDIQFYFKTKTIDYAIIGIDNYIEHNIKNKYIKIKLFKCKLCLIGNNNNYNKKKLICTKYTKLSKHILPTQTKLKKINGAVESCLINKLCNYIIDIVDTGTTLKANNLTQIKILKSIYSILLFKKFKKDNKLTKLKKFFENAKNKNI
ncbi:ATP phosphoribosyltransferase [Candidatus Vidania fulgoroideae]|nr:ATP phosphoribosyltransferase [Candidatus Vidania fulgoroideae]